ncbi:uncharacterized protein FOMMEDRAFT_17107 [Fomitiporia mediterranea MF3/22]|uniref:uncharacterized protein n=1 Tax=Fomitiporia mediterranea (strain MF3/22) TaxID=694068 RepID=UPI000440950B|nr:uncharacterized protein FOMMEDRAFT_17107 [Fomitiporia mediterranea MF3/22]EJD06601.1 hypothetical protein FOMMEDRAFT_17107 [Fomitiporia mediterranea MF3/22]
MDSQSQIQSSLDAHSPRSIGGGLSNGAKRPYEGSSSESVVSFATDSVSVTQSMSASVTNSVLGPDGKRPAKSSVSTAGCRQRVTVVCAECKRLKLKCDRRTPCGSCTKRDTIPRCIYSQAAAEKVDVQSLNIRLQAVEGKLNGIGLPADQSSSGAGPSNSRTAIPSSASVTRGRPRAFLAVGAHGTSVAVNLEGVTGLWVDHLGLRPSVANARAIPSNLGELEIEKEFWAAQEKYAAKEGISGLELRPFPSMPNEGVLEILEESSKLFRIPNSLLSSARSDTGDYVVVNDGDAEHDHERHAGEEREDEDSDQIGVSPKLVRYAFPPANVRAEIYKRYEAYHLLAPFVNFFVFKSRTEEMCRWADAELSGSGRMNEPPPTTGTSTSTTPPAARSVTTGPFAPPTLSFFAAASMGLAVGAQIWLAEREALSGDGNAGMGTTEHVSSPGTSNAVPGPSTNSFDKSMPPPPPPGTSFDNGPSTSRRSPDTSTSQTQGAPELDPRVPGKLYRLAKLALGLSLERGGYEAFDLDYVHAKCLQARYLLISHHGLGERGTDALRGLGVGRRKKIEKKGGKGKAGPNGILPTDEDSEEADAVMGDACNEPSSSQANANPSARGKGKARASARGPTLALAPEMVGAVGDAVANARMMGLNHDPELTGGGRFSLYEIEMRRRLWWEVVSLDAFVSGCLGESPFINDNSATTEFPTDVDEESFGPDSANRPAPNIETLHGNIDFFVQQCRLVALGKKLSRKAAAFRELHPDARPSDTHELVDTMKKEIASFLTNLPDYLKLKDLPSPTRAESRLMSPSSKKPVTSPGDRESSVSADPPPHLLMMRSVLAIHARQLFMTLCLPFTTVRISSNTSGSKVSWDARRSAFGTDNLGPSLRGLDSLVLLEPAIFIVQVWKHLHSSVREIRPAMFMCFQFNKVFFDATVVLGHLAIEHPLLAGTALATLRVASEVIRDPSVLTGRLSADEDGCGLPNEAVRIVEELVLKAESTAHEAISGGGLGLGFGGLGTSTPPIAKRKIEEVETAGSDLLYHFRFPFVGAGVVSAGPPPASAGTAGPTSDASPLTDGGNAVVPKPSEPTKSGNMRSKHASASDAAAAGDPRPATSKLKSHHPTLSVRSRVKNKDSSRARANSATSQRSDSSHMLLPMNPVRSSNSSISPAHATHDHNVPPNAASVESSTPVLGPYPSPLSSAPGPGPPHFTPPGTSSGSSSQQQTGGNEFTSAFHDTGAFSSGSPASYGPPFQSQQGSSLTVPSHVGFDGFGVGSSGQGQGRMSLGGGEAPPFSFGSTNGIDRPVGLHSSSPFDALGGLPRPPSDQDRPFSRNLVEPRNQGADESMTTSMQSLESQQPHPPQIYHSHPHSQSQPHSESLVGQQGWGQNGGVYPTTWYYQ